jgi:hemoglobin-like flavoprotein
MTPDQIHVLRKSFDRVEPQAQIAALSFYRRLFEMAPQFRPLFRTSIEEQAAKFMEMLSLAVHLTDRPARMETELRQLGARHVLYEVKDEYYEIVGRALMGMLADVLGAEFTPAARSAWEDFYTEMSDAMKRGAAIYLARDAEAQKAASATASLPG